MGVKQTALSLGKNSIRKLLFLAFFVAATLFSSLIINAPSSYAAPCPDGQKPGVAGTPQSDPNQCYATGSTTPSGPVQQDGTGETATPENPEGSAATGTESDDDGTTCAIEKVGWILCPVIEASGKIGDQAFQFLAKTFLETEPELVSNSEHGTQHAWNLARNLANVMFIIAFLFIIYSQVTGAGINNYGIKKMLPRLIVAAIAVNASYYICQAMVDLSNVMGYEIQNFMVDTASQISDRAAMPPSSGIDVHTSNGTLGSIIAAVLGVAAVVWFLLPVIALGVGTVLITCIVIIIILLLRKAFIVLLIVAAPIAFVLYLLPNTEKFFQKWLSMFWKLLMVFPVVGILMGGGQLASAIILAAGSTGENSIYADSSGKCVELPKYGDVSQNDTSTDTGGAGQSAGDNTGNNDTTTQTANKEVSARTSSCGPNSTPLMLGLIAAGIAVAPLLAVWSVLKGALNAAGAIGGKIAGAVEAATRKGADWGSKNTAVGRGMAARQAIKQNYKDQRFADRMSQSGKRGRLTRIAARGVAGNAGLGAEKLTGALPDNGALGQAKKGINFATGSLQAQSTKLSANFAGAAAKIEDQDTKDQEALLGSMLRNSRGQKDANGNLISDETKLAQRLEQAIINGDKAGAKAATNLLAARGQGGTRALAETISQVQGVDNSAMAEFRSHISNNMSQLKSSDADIYAWAGDTNGRTLDEIGADAATYAKITNDQLATQTARSLSNTGAAASIAGPQTIVDQQGRTYQVTRGQAILNSKAGSEIKAENRGHFG